MDNKNKYYLHKMFYSVAFMFCTGSILQTFMLSLGIEQRLIYLYETIITMVQFCVMTLSVFFADKIKNVGIFEAFNSLMLIPLFVVLIIVASLRTVKADFYIPILAIATLPYVFIGINSIVSYRFPYEIIDIKEYGRFTGTSGIITGIVAFSVSMIYSVFVQKGNILYVNIGFFSFSIICLVIGATAILRCQKVPAFEMQRPQKRGLNLTVFKNKKVWALMLPNFLRGFSTGIIGLFAVIAISNGIIPNEQGSILAVILQIATLFGGFLFILMIRKIKVHYILISAAICMSFLLPISMLWKNAILFYILYFLIRTFMIMVDTSIPVSITKFIPYEQIGAFTSIRMMFFTLGQAIAPSFLALMEKSLFYPFILLIVAACQLMCCVAYFFVAKNNKTGA